MKINDGIQDRTNNVGTRDSNRVRTEGAEVA